jgi:large subunit ribosomal protein LP2
MKELAAYMLLVLGGNATPSTDDVTAVITSAGGEVDADRLTALFADLEGKDFNEILASGREALKDVSMGGGGAAPAAAAAGGAAPAAAAAPAKPKEEEVDPMEGGMDMFGGGGSDY